MSQLSQTIGLTAGWILVGWAAMQGVMLAVKTVLRRQRAARDYERQRDEFRERIATAVRAARGSKAILDWSGWRRFRVAAIVDEARDTKSFYLTPEDGQPLAPFVPGQYLTFRLPASAGDAPVVRCYSLSDRPRQDFFRVTIKRIGPPAGAPSAAPGRGSTFFHTCVEVGEMLDVRAPSGTFLIDPYANEPIVFIGAGIGVTPLVSMLEAIAAVGSKRDVYALFGFRSGGEHPFKERLAAIGAANPQIRLQVSYSAPRETDVLHRDYHHHGRLSFERVREALPSNNFHFYVCGPGTLMESLVPALWGWGVPEAYVHFEAFGPASVRSASHATRTQSCQVRFERSGRTAKWDGSLASILQFGEAAGVKMPSGCRAGGCGECIMAIRGGDIRTVKQPGIAVPSGSCLTCISVPAGDLVLDA